MVIGVIGGVGAGKSTVLETLRQNYDFQVYRTDDMAKQLYRKGSPIFAALTELLGEEILTSDGEGLQLAALATRLYNEPTLRKKLENIVHPAVWQDVHHLARKAKKEEIRIVVETALPNQAFLADCDEVWFVYTERETRIQRLMESRGYSRERAESIIAAQPEDDDYAALSDFVINNSFTEEETRNEIYEHCKWLQR